MEDLSLRAMTREEQTALALGDASKLSGEVGTEPVGLEGHWKGSLAGRWLEPRHDGRGGRARLLEAVPGEPGLPSYRRGNSHARRSDPCPDGATAQSDQTAQAESEAAAAAEASNPPNPLSR